MIIGIAGRKGSGKSSVSAELINQGFIRVSFADYLKECCAKLGGFEINSMYSPSLKEENFEKTLVWNSTMCDSLSEIVGEDIEFTIERELVSRRDMMQYIGTDVLRKHDPNFHIKKTRERLVSHPKVFVDDMRFPNEKDLIEGLGGTCIFIIRPSNFKYSNHYSEISLTRHNFDTVLINDCSEKTLRKKFLNFINTIELRNNDKLRSPLSKSDLLEALSHHGSSSAVANAWGCSRDKIVWWAEKLLVRLSRNKYVNDSNAFSAPSLEASYWAGVISADGCIKFSGKSKSCMVLELFSLDLELIENFKCFLRTNKPVHESISKINKKIGYQLTINDPFIVEDLKLWNVEPRKSRYNKVPDIIRHDDLMVSQWIVGLIDGDGSIYITGKGLLGINLIASLEVINFVKQWANLRCSMSQEKKVENLYSLRFSGRYAVAFYHKVFRGRGLNRKWDKVLQYLKKGDVNV